MMQRDLEVLSMLFRRRRVIILRAIDLDNRSRSDRIRSHRIADPFEFDGVETSDGNEIL